MACVAYPYGVVSTLKGGAAMVATYRQRRLCFSVQSLKEWLQYSGAPAAAGLEARNSDPLRTQSSRALLNLVSIKCRTALPADSTTADTPKPFLVLPRNDPCAVGCSFLFCNNLTKYHGEEYPAASAGYEHIRKMMLSYIFMKPPTSS